MITFWKNRVSQVSDPPPRKAAPAVALQPAAKMVAIPKISPAVGTALHGQARGESAEPSAAAFVESLASAAKAAPPPPPGTELIDGPIWTVERGRRKAPKNGDFMVV